MIIYVCVCALIHSAPTSSRRGLLNGRLRQHLFPSLCFLTGSPPHMVFCREIPLNNRLFSAYWQQVRRRGHLEGIRFRTNTHVRRSGSSRKLDPDPVAALCVYPGLTIKVKKKTSSNRMHCVDS